MSIDTDDVYPAIVPVNRESKTSHQTMQSLYISWLRGLTAGRHRHRRTAAVAFAATSSLFCFPYLQGGSFN